MKKSYIVMLKEDVGPYLIKREPMLGLTSREVYTFFIPPNSKDRHVFVDLTRRYKCWKYMGGNTYTYESSASTMKEIADRMDKDKKHGKSDHAVDALTYINDLTNPCKEVFLKEYKADFKQTEKQVKNKFNTVSTTNITVNGKNFNLVYPFPADMALEAILELSERINTLNDKGMQLATINDKDSETDNIALDNVLRVISDEISEIKDMIDYVNDNIV